MKVLLIGYIKFSLIIGHFCLIKHLLIAYIESVRYITLHERKNPSINNKISLTQSTQTWNDIAELQGDR